MKKWIKNILGITTLETVVKVTQDKVKTLINNESFVLQEVDNIKKLINVGVDLNYHHPSENWAVICIQGKPDYIKFVDLNQIQARDLQKFLRNFDHRNVVLDAPRIVSKKRLLKL